MKRRALPVRWLRRALPVLLIAGAVLAACGPTPLPPFPAREGGTRGEGAPPSLSERGAGGIGPRAARLEPPSDPPAGLSAGDWAGIREQIERDRYRIERRGAGGGSVYQAANPAQRLRLGFRPGGIEASPLGDGDWSLGLRLASWGYGADQQEAAPAEPLADENRVEYRRESLVEWYLNERRGLEQGFTLLEPPAADGGAGQLRLELTASGSLVPRVVDDGRAILWQDGAGGAVLRYGGLAAWDAGGRALPVAIGLTPGGFWLEVDDRAAEYPLTVDPWIEQAALEPTGAANDRFGYGVAVNGNFALVGAPYADVGGKADQGAAYVFLRGGTTWIQQQRLLAEDGKAGDLFGQSVVLSGNTALVGAYSAAVGANQTQGAAYVFVRNESTWTQQQKLTQAAADGKAGDFFGMSVALSGETALVGAPLADLGGNSDQGAAYVFIRSGTTWTQQQKLNQSDSDGLAGDNFGQSVALDGGTALVGAPGANQLQGVAYAFVRSGATWSEQQKLTALDGKAGDVFGGSVALSGETAVVGAANADPGDSVNQGAAYVFVRTGGATWTEQQKLTQTAPDGAPFDGFGASVALSGETALVGATGASTSRGAAYVFVRSGTTWAQQQKLTADDGVAFDFFGSSVALSGETALVGAVGVDVGENQEQGAAYVFVRDGTTWTQQQKLLADDSAFDEVFGSSVALDGDTALVGARFGDVRGNPAQGAAYVFVRSGTTWRFQQKLTQTAPDGGANDFFGQSVALSGDTALIGAPNADPGGKQNQGAAYVFVRNGTAWTEQQRLVPADGAVGDNFGHSVALSGERALVGAILANVGGNQAQGAAHVFVRSGTTWAQQGPRLLADDGAASDTFGRSAALSGETALVGASLVDVDGKQNQGAAYVFTLSGTTWVQRAKLTADDGKTQDNFGESVALSGETALVGAHLADVDGRADRGAAYAFVGQGTSWAQQQKLIVNDGGPGHLFGERVALSGETALIGARGAFVDGRFGQGAAYVFARQGGAWAQRQQLTASAVNAGQGGVGFGSSVALDGETALVGAPHVERGVIGFRGLAYVFVFSPDPISTPTATATSTPTVDPGATATPTATATVDASVTPTATPTFVPCKPPKPKLKVKLRKGTRTYDLTIDPKSFGRPCSFVRAVVNWGDTTGDLVLTSPSASHTYANAGQYTLRVRLTDTGGHADVAAKPKTLKVK